MPSLIESPLQLQAAGAWGSLYCAQEPVKPRPMIPAAAAAAAAKKQPAYGVRWKNLETCTEALGCETGAVDTTPPPAGNGGDGGGVEAECAERKRRAREDEAEAIMARRPERRRGPLPPPLTTLSPGVRMVHERRNGRLEVFAVRTPGVLGAERSGGRLRLRLLLPLARRDRDAGNNAVAAASCGQERRGRLEEAKEAEEEEEEEYGFSKYVRGGRCVVEPEGGAAAAARRGKQWELELSQYPCIF